MKTFHPALGHNSKLYMTNKWPLIIYIHCSLQCRQAKATATKTEKTNRKQNPLE